MIINLNDPNNDKFLEIKGNELLLTDEHYEQMKSYDYIIFSYHFNQQLSKLPQNIKIIQILSTNYTYPLENLPINLEALQLSFINSDLPYKLDLLPYGLKTLYITGSNYILENLPGGLKHLLISGNNIHFEINNLPCNLEYLYIEMTNITCDINIGNLPSNLKILQFRKYSKNNDNQPLYKIINNSSNNNSSNNNSSNNNSRNNIKIIISTLSQFVLEIINYIGNYFYIPLNFEIIIDLMDYSFSEYNSRENVSKIYTINNYNYKILPQTNSYKSNIIDNNFIS